MLDAILSGVRDSVWQFVGVVVALLLYLAARKRKAVSFNVAATTLLTVSEELEGKIQVLYEGEPAKSLTVMTIKVWNSGNQPILKSDYEHPITFSSGEKSTILAATVVEAEPITIDAVARAQGNVVVLDPALLNPGDAVTIKVLARDAGETIDSGGRIAGVKQLQANRGGQHMLRLGISGVIMGFTAGFIVSWAKWENRLPLLDDDALQFAFVVFLVAFVAGSHAFYHYAKETSLRKFLHRLQ